MASAHDLPGDVDLGGPYDALLVVSFGGPEAPDDVLPFMENVTRGRGIPRERLVAVSEHYQLFGGVSPINAQNRGLVAAVEAELAGAGVELPVYWGNRNWHPMLPVTLARMRDDGVRRALAFVTSAFSSYSGCRQYREDLARARHEVGAGAPQIDKLRAFYNHPGFVGPMATNLRVALAGIPEDRRAAAQVVFTAHSIPVAMADGSAYVAQLREASRLVAAEAAPGLPWELVFQSRSGPPSVPWLEPDVNDHLADLHRRGVRDVAVVPIGFVSDHMEVRFDLDVEAARTAGELGLHLVRAATVGNHPRFAAMVRQLVEERISAHPVRLAMGLHGPSHDACALDCCPAPVRRPAPAEAGTGAPPAPAPSGAA